MNHWLALGIAIIAEVIATSSLKASNEFTALVPSIIVVVGYAVAFYFMTVSMRVLPIGIMYAVWSGLGIVLVSLIGWLFYHQSLDVPAVLGIGLIVSGVVVIHLFSSAIGH